MNENYTRFMFVLKLGSFLGTLIQEPLHLFIQESDS